MPTPAERKALAFVALVVLLGGAVRIVRAGALAPLPSIAEQQALARQSFAASSAAVAIRIQKGPQSRKKAKTAPKYRYDGAKFDSTGLLIEGTGVVSSTSATGFPPPSPRIDIDTRLSTQGAGAQNGPRGGKNGHAGMAAPGALVDMDVADATQIERLPRIGPALAKRIVANRDSLGPFGSLPALGRVKGMGSATLKQLGPLVTFSGQVRR
jgi:hypothetical protein